MNFAKELILLHSLQHTSRMLKKIQQRGAMMAFWNKKLKDFEIINKIIWQQPGITQAQLARQLGVPRSTIARRLPSMEEAGYLYSEDDRGRLWLFQRRI